MAVQHLDRAKSFLGWAFIMSLAVHLIVGPMVGKYRPSRPEDQAIEKVSLTRRLPVVVPAPTPTPRPPKRAPKPVVHKPSPARPAVKIDVVHTRSRADDGTSEARHTIASGADTGVHDGTGASEPATAVTPAATPPPPPTPSPKPECAQPHVDATTTEPLTPDTPDSARQEGATGTVQIRVSLSATGSVVSAEVYKSSGFSLLDRAALRAAQGSAYAPEIDDCVKVAGDYIFRADFEGN